MQASPTIAMIGSMVTPIAVQSMKKTLATGQKRNILKMMPKLTVSVSKFFSNLMSPDTKSAIAWKRYKKGQTTSRKNILLNIPTNGFNFFV